MQVHRVLVLILMQSDSSLLPLCHPELIIETHVAVLYITLLHPRLQNHPLRVWRLGSWEHTMMMGWQACIRCHLPITPCSSCRWSIRIESHPKWRPASISLKLEYPGQPAGVIDLRIFGLRRMPNDVHDIVKRLSLRPPLSQSKDHCDIWVFSLDPKTDYLVIESMKIYG